MDHRRVDSDPWAQAAIPEALEILADAVLNPRFTAWEVAASAAQLEDQVKELGNSPASLLLEVAAPP